MIHFHPAATVEYHRLILEHIRPELIRTVRENPDCILQENSRDPESAIEDSFEGMPTSRWSFLLMDSDQPCIPGLDPPWYYRGTVECNGMHFMVHSDFHLCLHPSIGFRRVRSLLADPMFAGLPPTLHIEHDPDENESWTITFHHDTGVGWHALEPAYARRYFLAALEETLQVIRAVRVFSRDYRNSAAFRAVRMALRTAYESF